MISCSSSPSNSKSNVGYFQYGKFTWLLLSSTKSSATLKFALFITLVTVLDVENYLEASVFKDLQLQSLFSFLLFFFVLKIWIKAGLKDEIFVLQMIKFFFQKFSFSI